MARSRPTAYASRRRALLARRTKPSRTDEPSQSSTHWILEFDALRQQLQRLAEVVSRYANHVGLQRISVDGLSERSHMHPQLMSTSGARRQPVHAVRRYRLHQRLGVGLARFFDGL